MPLFTYEDVNGVSQNITDQEIKELVDEAREIDPRIEVKELIFSEKQCRSLFKKRSETKPQYTYVYYLYIKGKDEAQCILGGSGEKKIIKAWLFGFLTATDLLKKEGGNNALV